MLTRKRVKTVGLWLLFCLAAGGHVMATIKFKGTSSETLMVATVAILIFICGVLAGWTMAMDLEIDPPLPPLPYKQPVRQQRSAAYRQNGRVNGQVRRVMPVYEEFEDEDDGIFFTGPHDEREAYKRSRVRQRPPGPRDRIYPEPKPSRVVLRPPRPGSRWH